MVFTYLEHPSECLDGFPPSLSDWGYNTCHVDEGCPYNEFEGHQEFNSLKDAIKSACERVGFDEDNGGVTLYLGNKRIGYVHAWGDHEQYVLLTDVK